VQDLRERVRQASLEEADDGIVSVYLFGSQASSRVHRESDIDLGVLLSWGTCRTSKDRFELRVGMSSRLTSVLGRPVDVVILNDAPPQFARRIVTTGERLFCSDAEVDHAFVRDIQIKAADIEPFLRRTRRIKLDAIMR
jgi:predicted nucleotidyltransferase